MIGRRFPRTTALAGVLLAALALAACGKTGASGGDNQPGQIVFSILPTGPASELRANWDPVLADMEKSTGLKIKPYIPSNYTVLIEAMKFKQTDAGWFSNESGLEAVRRANGEVFARTVGPKGIDGYYSVLITNAKTGVTLDRVLKCDKTLTLGMGDPNSTSGTIVPVAFFFGPHKIKPQDCFKIVRSSSHNTNLMSVANGGLDVATNNSTALMMNRESGRHEADNVKVIWQSPLLPEDPIIWRKDLDPAIKEKLRQFFLTYGVGDTPEAQVQRERLAKLHIGGFKPADDSHLMVVREIEAREKLVLAQQGGDTAKIDDARKALDDIVAQRQALEARTRAPAAAQ
ncbi:MAG: phosphate/phosphite/phosphonate ABC transporter substrate-binding protein [Caulobacterales bacterium]